MAAEREPFDYLHQGEYPGDEKLLRGPAEDYLFDTIDTRQSLSPEGTVLDTIVDGKVISVEALKKLIKRSSEEIVDRRTEIEIAAAASLTVIAIIGAANAIHARRKPQSTRQKLIRKLKS